jgi:hypothetical protein
VRDRSWVILQERSADYNEFIEGEEGTSATTFCKIEL